MLLTRKGGARHDEHALVGRCLALVGIDALDRGQGEEIAHTAPGALRGLVFIVALARIEEVGVGGVHPPGIDAIVEKALQMVPIYLSGHRAVGIIHLDTRRIFHAWRPDVRDTALRPCINRQQEVLLGQFAILKCVRTETGPDGNHDVCVLLVHPVNHLLAVGKLLGEEVHGIPQIVAAPVLPVLDDSVERHLKATMHVHHLQEFLR